MAGEGCPQTGRGAHAKAGDPRPVLAWQDLGGKVGEEWIWVSPPSYGALFFKYRVAEGG